METKLCCHLPFSLLSSWPFSFLFVYFVWLLRRDIVVLLDVEAYFCFLRCLRDPTEFNYHRIADRSQELTGVWSVL